MNATQTRRSASGLSLIEALMVLLISSILVSSALPGLREWRMRQVLQATAATLDTDLRYARSMALSSDAPVRLSVQALPEGGSCTLIHTGDAADCRCLGNGQGVCQAGARLLHLSEQAESRGAVIVYNGRSMVFDPGKGTVTPAATLVVADTHGRSIRKIVNILGRVRSCSPDGLAGLQRCA